MRQKRAVADRAGERLPLTALFENTQEGD